MKPESYLFLLHFIFLYVYVWVHPRAWACGKGAQRTTFRDWSPVPIMQVLWIKLRSSGLVHKCFYALIHFTSP